MTELKPCPFCGRSDPILSRVPGGRDGPAYHKVICGCGAEFIDISMYPQETTAESVAAKWNRRA